MKKLINKLFEWLGYVPKGSENNITKRQIINAICDCRSDRIDWTQVFQQDSLLMDNWLHKYECFNYSISRVGFFYEVKIYWMYDLMKAKITIKRFFTDDADYARICAEELCEKLNERI